MRKTWRRSKMMPGAKRSGNVIDTIDGDREGQGGGDSFPPWRRAARNRQLMQTSRESDDAEALEES